jgi:hypothetical protein
MLRTLDYAGICIQARHVGGDYYDFLDLGRDRLALVVGDIAGKGIAAALLMANLQANLRSQCAIALKAPKRFLASVNRMLFENTTPSAYATLFFAEYDDRSRRLRYANCGHLCALILHPNGKIERLDSTCPSWGSSTTGSAPSASASSRPETSSPSTPTASPSPSTKPKKSSAKSASSKPSNATRNYPPTKWCNAIVGEVQTFTCPERGQYDDITVIVAKCTAEA